MQGPRAEADMHDRSDRGSAREEFWPRHLHLANVRITLNLPKAKLSILLEFFIKRLYSSHYHLPGILNLFHCAERWDAVLAGLSKADISWTWRSARSIEIDDLLQILRKLGEVSDFSWYIRPNISHSASFARTIIFTRSGFIEHVLQSSHKFRPW